MREPAARPPRCWLAACLLWRLTYAPSSFPNRVRLAALFVEYRSRICMYIYTHANLAAPPPREPPPSLLAAFTLNHSVPLEFYYVDDSNKGQGELACRHTAVSPPPPIYCHLLSLSPMAQAPTTSTRRRKLSSWCSRLSGSSSTLSPCHHPSLLTPSHTPHGSPSSLISGWFMPCPAILWLARV